MIIARLNNNVVTNIEVVDESWLEGNKALMQDIVVVTEEHSDAPPTIGLSYDPVTGFEQPEVIEG